MFAFYIFSSKVIDGSLEKHIGNIGDNFIARNFRSIRGEHPSTSVIPSKRENE